MKLKHELDQIQRLRTQRFILREISEKDKLDIYELFAQEEVVRYTPLPRFTSIHEAVREIQWIRSLYTNKTGARWGIEAQDTGKIIGTCGFLNYEKQHNRAEIGYDLLPCYWNQGIMSEVLNVVLEYAFIEWKLNKIVARVIPGNSASESLLKKFGFEIEGLLRQHEYEKGEYVDLISFALLKQQYIYE